MNPESATTPDESFDELLSFLKSARGLDLESYKRTTLSRRFDKRIAELRLNTYADYLGYMEANPREISELLRAVEVNVTDFFRDPDVWDYLSKAVIQPRLRSGDSGPYRVWSVGTASGQEAYSIAMILADVLGVNEFAERVKIYATDIDERALEAGRHGSYLPKDVESVPARFRERFLSESDGRFRVRPELRRAVIFGRNDLTSDAPISRISLLLCRNTLMYFNIEVQRAIINHFHFALEEGGCLCLGKSEMLTDADGPFAPIDLRMRIFRRADDPTVTAAGVLRRRSGPTEPQRDGESSTAAALRDDLFEQASAAQVVVDRDGVLLQANRRARSMFGLGAIDIGRPLANLSIATSPVNLSSALDSAALRRSTVVLPDAAVAVADGNEARVQAIVSPLTDRTGGLLAISVTYFDVSGYADVASDLERSRAEVRETGKKLQSTVEELEKTNQELQSTNEELETTNEELQSTNEELETTNEELHSTNEELKTINEELTLRTSELEQASGLTTAILSSLSGFVVVVDGTRRVREWNETAEQTWGLRRSDVLDTQLDSLEFGIPVTALLPAVRACIDGTSELEELALSGHDRTGRAISVALECRPLRVLRGEVSGAIVVGSSRLQDMASSAPESRSGRFR